MANVWILTSDKPTGDGRMTGIWLRDLGFKLIEAGVEINLQRLDGQKARATLSAKGIEVLQVFDPYKEVTRQGATSMGEGRFRADVGADLNS